MLWAASTDTLSMAYDITDTRWEGITYARSSVGEQIYNDLTVTIDGLSYAVVTEPSYRVVWDEIVILTTVIQSGDDYVNIENSVTITVTAELDYLNHMLDPSVDTLHLNGVEMLNGGTYFTLTLSYAYPNFMIYSVDDSNAIETTYGISKIASGKPSISCTWDTFSVDLEVDDAHVSITENVRIWAYVTRAMAQHLLTVWVL